MGSQVEASAVGVSLDLQLAEHIQNLGYTNTSWTLEHWDPRGCVPVSVCVCLYVCESEKEIYMGIEITLCSVTGKQYSSL